MQIPLLDPELPSFPQADAALREPNGLLAAGGNLSVKTLLQAYRKGIFPWFEQDQPILWWSPEPRMVLYPDAVHISRSMRKKLRLKDYEIRIDTAFEQVVQFCAAPRITTVTHSACETGDLEHTLGGHTWIVPAMITAYRQLFDAGIAHSVECWIDGELAGGLYGLVIGGFFCGESMFSLQPDTSKLALIHLSHALKKGGFSLIDCQLPSSHLTSLGAVELSRSRFLKILDDEKDRLLSWPDAANFDKVIDHIT